MDSINLKSHHFRLSDSFISFKQKSHVFSCLLVAVVVLHVLSFFGICLFNGKKQKFSGKKEQDII